MTKRSLLFLITCVTLMFASCKKDALENNSSTNLADGAESSIKTTATTAAIVPSNAIVYDLGTGSGDLVIDGSSYNVNNNYLVKIKAGTYNTITIKNIAATAANQVFIKNNGIVKITGSIQTSNISNVVISGDYTSGITYGFQFENIAFRAITMDGKMDGVTIKSMSFVNVSDYVIAGEKTNGTSLAYQGTDATRTDSFKILNCLFDNAGTISFGGNLNSETGEDSGLFKDVEIANNIFQNSDAGTLCSFTNVQDYNIHNNTVNNVNPTNNNHNGIFFMQGNGSFHDNKLTNYQGNSIRMWLYSRGTTPVTNTIYNNICYNTRKYGAFEVQGFTRNIYSGKSTYANASVYNNTVGRMNTSKDWEGQVLDLYNINGGSLQFYNNLGFELVSATKISNMINNESDTKITKLENNKYAATYSSVIANLSNFLSLITGIGEAGL